MKGNTMKESMLNTTMFATQKDGKIETKTMCGNDSFVICFVDDFPELFDLFYETKERTKGRIHRLVIETN